ncbi:hypothetical protein GCM10011386_23760 [Parapedobacter defluvii]|uniref:Uncharacterized protein n=1 Tax=Parapedobacter defluvii TaxID=2045106 RepID=A0ABQ1LZ66_9SPHI|nr:hypothetical protein GCM10011386_23760 [Parapedobacter defluvii]
MTVIKPACSRQPFELQSYNLSGNKPYIPEPSFTPAHILVIFLQISDNEDDLHPNRQFGK